MVHKLVLAAVVLLVGGLLVTPQAQAQSIGQCTNAELKASYRSSGAGLSHHYGRIVLRNVSGHACRTGGYGGVSYVGHGDGTQIGAAAERTRSRVRTLVVRPGQRVVSALDETSVAPYPRHRCRPAHVDGFRIYLPNATRSQYVVHPTTGCRNHRVHLLAHKAYRRP